MYNNGVFPVHFPDLQENTNMIKTLQLICLAILALAVAGCGKRGQVPETTVLAAYVDLEKTYENGKDLAQAILDALPADRRPPALKVFEEAFKEIDKYKDALHPEWAVVAYGGDIKSVTAPSNKNIAIAVGVETDEGTVVKFLKEDGVEMKKYNRDDGVVFQLGPKHVGLIDNKYLVVSPSKDAFDDMFDLYADKGKPSKDFGDLTRIPRNAICRIATAPVSSLLTRFGLTQEIENFGEISADDDLADMILCLGAVSLDVWADSMDVSLLLRVTCGSAGDAKILDHFFQSIAFSSRVACAVGAFAAKVPGKFGGLAHDAASAQDAFIALAHAVEAKRDGNVASLSCAVSSERLAEAFSKTPLLTGVTGWSK